MLVLLGIIILAISFVVALVSLVREEKKNQQLAKAESESEELVAQQDPDIVVEESKRSSEPLEELKAKIDAEEKRQKLEQSMADGEDTVAEVEPDEQIEPPAAEVAQTDREAFPWEETGDEKSSLVPGDNVLESVVEETVQETLDDELTPEQSRFPNLGTGQKPLSGSFKLKKD